MINVKIFNSIDNINVTEYCTLKSLCAGSIFYDIGFLRASEQAHLLPLENTYYLAAYDGNDLVAFMPTYLQSAADPFGILQDTTGIEFGNHKALFSHIMHCYDSMILAVDKSKELYNAIFSNLKNLANEQNVKYGGLINVSGNYIISHELTSELNVKYMWDRFYVDLSNTTSIEGFLKNIGRDGRQAYNRHKRKFDSSGALFKMESLSEINLHEIVDMCYETTKKHGTEHYYPRQSMVKFITLCSNIVRILSIYLNGRRVAAGVCFIESDKLHLWACGMVYDDVPFSPYIMAIYSALQYALEKNIRTVEIGRTNGKMKQKLGFLPQKLYSIIN